MAVGYKAVMVKSDAERQERAQVGKTTDDREGVMPELVNRLRAAGHGLNRRRHARR